MTTFNHALGARARRRNALLLRALASALILRGAGWLRRLMSASMARRGREAVAWRELARQRAAESAYWVNASVHAWPRGGPLRRPDAA